MANANAKSKKRRMHVVEEDDGAKVGQRRRSKRGSRSKRAGALKENMGSLAIALGIGGLATYFGLKALEKKDAARREAEDLSRARDAERIARMLQPIAQVQQARAQAQVQQFAVEAPAPEPHQTALLFSFMEDD